MSDWLGINYKEVLVEPQGREEVDKETVLDIHETNLQGSVTQNKQQA